MIEHWMESLMFKSRWLLAPFYVGLVLAILALLVKFGQEGIHIGAHLFSMGEREVILGILAMVDVTLVANLLIMVVFSGYENFVSKIDTGDSPDRPSWMGKVDYSGLKLKLIGSIVAISAIDLLKIFMNIKDYSNDHLFWTVVIHMTFVVSGLLFAWTDKVAASTPHH